MKKKPKKKVSGDKQSTLADLLRKHGAQIYDDLDKGNFPKFSIPSRSVSNIVSVSYTHLTLPTKRIV